MIRRRPLQRTRWQRRLSNQPRARGRESASPEQWQIICAEVRRRAGWCCEACGRRGRLDVHHVVKRSQGGSDFDLDLLVALCRPCHAQTDAPWVKGRLVIRPLGSGRFVFDTVTVTPRLWDRPVRVQRML
jgi:5-methylcytosine-specific restriction endonuclease McrA